MDQGPEVFGDHASIVDARRQGDARDGSYALDRQIGHSGHGRRGTYEDGAVAALLIVIVGLIPVAILLRLGRRGQQALR